MSKQKPVVIERFVNGWASSIKEGPADSFYYSRHIDFRKDPRLLSILPASVKETGNTVTGLITEMIQLPSGKEVAIDITGGIYTRSTLGVWAKQSVVLPDTAYGMVYNQQQDTIYISGSTSVHSISNADGRFGGTFTVNVNVFMATQDQASSGGHANSYTTLPTITEAATDRLSIIPTIEPLYSVKIYVLTKGTGDLTVTMHDAANNVLGTATLVNTAVSLGQTTAGVAAGTYNEFIFTPPPRMLVKPNAGTYHFHITHSNGTASTIGVATSNDFSTADFSSWSNRLVQPNNGFHPIYEFLQYYLFLNERYVAVWEPLSQTNPSNAEWQRHRLVFPAGYEGTSACLIDEYIVIGAEKRSTSATNEYQKGKLFIWDGTAVSYNRVIDVPEGSPYGLFSVGNVAYYFANGKLWAWSTGNPVPVWQMPNTDFEFTDTNTYMVNYPHTLASRNSILLGAFPSETNSTNIEHAVYSFGKRNKNYDNSFGYSYSMSTGSRTNGTLRIGTIQARGDKLFIAWRDDSQPVGQRYGVDKIDPNSDPFASGTWESLIIDNGRPDKTKEAVSLRVDFKPLPTGATLTPKYKIDRSSMYTTGDTSISGSDHIILNINKRYKEIQLAFDVTAISITPEIISLTLVWESLSSEAD